jgi:hypothetical protein
MLGYRWHKESNIFSAACECTLIHTAKLHWEFHNRPIWILHFKGACSQASNEISRLHFKPVSGCDWLGPICRRLAQSGLLVFTSRLVGKGYTTINLVPTPQVKRVSSSQRSPVEFAKDCCGALQMRSLGCFSKDLSILSLVTGTPKGDS